MKKIVSLFVLALILATNISAQENTIYIKSAKFVSPLLEKWIQEYKKVNPSADIQIAGKQIKAEDAQLNLIINDNNTQQTGRVSFIGRYAVLPVTTSGSPILKELSDKKLNKKRLNDLFFEKDLLDDSKSKEKYTATVYSGNNETSVASVFASHFGYDNSSLKGKKISGDDIFLLNAIQKDNTGITFNSLAYLYDINTRQLKKGLSILPLDIKKEHREALDSNNIDEVVALLEATNVDLIPVENISFAYAKNNSEVNAFVKWVLENGQSYNNQYGFLKLQENVLASQLELLEKDVYLTSTK